jgi:hypothetical protein
MQKNTNKDFYDIYDADFYAKYQSFQNKAIKYPEYERLKSLIANVDDERKVYYLNNLQKSNQLKYMNLQLLAEVITFMNSVNDVVNKKTVNYNSIKPYIDHILPSEKEYVASYGKSDYDSMVQEMVASFFRYIRHIKMLL